MHFSMNHLFSICIQSVRLVFHGRYFSTSQSLTIFPNIFVQHHITSPFNTRFHIPFQASNTYSQYPHQAFAQQWQGFHAFLSLPSSFHKLPYTHFQASTQNFSTPIKLSPNSGTSNLSCFIPSRAYFRRISIYVPRIVPRFTILFLPLVTTLRSMPVPLTYNRSPGNIPTEPLQLRNPTHFTMTGEGELHSPKPPT